MSCRKQSIEIMSTFQGSCACGAAEGGAALAVTPADPEAAAAGTVLAGAADDAGAASVSRWHPVALAIDARRTQENRGTPNLVRANGARLDTWRVSPRERLRGPCHEVSRPGRAHRPSRATSGLRRRLPRRRRAGP